MPKDNGKRTQKTKTGFEIPVPTKEDVFGTLDRAAKKAEEKPSARGKARRRTSRDR
jgi:hypothetical protein